MKHFILLSLFLNLYLTALGQQVLQGKITDEQGVSIPNAYLNNLRNGMHTHTNDFGNFIFKNIRINDTLEVSYLGFENKRIIVQANDLEEGLLIRLKERTFDLTQVTVTKQVRQMNAITDLDLKVTPVNSAQEILRKVPGLFIGQHAGGGKAEQIFLRGFDIDHGTDVNISVDGIPVNMVSHAHGQGYADLHFLIPETIEKIDFGKGTYFADKGDFTTAGYVDFRTKERLDRSSVSLEYGQFNTLRTAGLFNLLDKNQETESAYLATEYLTTDGAFDAPQNFTRLNLMGKYSTGLGQKTQFSALASYFQSRWDASGQIPQRAVESGMISRFGAIDDTEGGATSRTNLLFSLNQFLDKNTVIKNRVFYTKYNFELYSNFTFFLEDSLNGDQIRQKESRDIFGMESTFNQITELNKGDLYWTAGLGFRFDNVQAVELSHTRNRRETLSPLALGDVTQTNFYGFINTELDLGDWRINPSIRFDQFQFGYNNQLSPTYDNQSVDKRFISPKLNIIYAPTASWQLFLKMGRGFHSNDSRVVVAQEGLEILPAAYGADLGGFWKPSSKILINAAFWYLYLEQEFVYVGDAGIVEPSGESRRLGVDVGLRYQLNNWLFLDADVNYAYARSLADTDGENFIPLAPDLTSTGGLSWQHPSGFSGGLRYRYLKSRPANEDASITAVGYFLTDTNLNYTFKHLSLGLIIENLFNTEWKETQFATESRLQNELEPVEEIHFIPGTPFFLKARLNYIF